VTTTINYGGDHDVRLAPPTASPKIAWQRALNLCVQCGIPGMAQTNAPIVELASFSDYGYMVDGSNHPIYQNVLAYIVMWNGVACVGSQPPNQPTPSPDPQQNPNTCDDFYVVNATTGHPLNVSYQWPEP
jgi:hypothetical protein